MQNLNLYRPERPGHTGGPQPWLMRAGLLALLGVLVLHGLWQGWSLHRLDDAVALAQRQAQTAEDELSTARANHKEPQLDASLPQRLARLEEGNQQLQRMGERLRLLDEQHARGFAAPLQALAEQHPEGLWLTRIYLAEGGARVLLEGLSQDQELLPLYVQSLGHSDSFQGRRFVQLDLQRTADGLLRFDLGTEDEDEEGGDAQ